MAEQLLLDRGGPRSIRLATADGVVTVKRAGGGGWEVIFLLLPLVLLTLVIFGALVGVVCMSWIAATQFSGLALLVAIVLGIALLPGLYAWFVVQGLVLPFTAALGSGRYQLANGLLRFSRRVPPQEAHVVVYPTYSRGGWGYGAKLKLTGKTLALPFVPKSIIGTKHDALQEAVKIRDWLQRNSTVADVTLAEWGDTHQVQPGVDYIR
jgi:hypothetical protein